MRRGWIGLALVAALALVGGVRADEDRAVAHGRVDDMQRVTPDTGIILVDVHNADGTDKDRAYYVTEETTVEIVLVKGHGANRKVIDREPGDVEDISKGEHVRVVYGEDSDKAIRIAVIYHVD